MVERKRETIEANFVKLKSLTMDQLRIAAAGPGEYASDAKLEIKLRVAEAEMSAAKRQADASWMAVWATIGLVLATLLLGLIALLSHLK